ncbi:MAG TPA: sigma-70 family RNA polymerase sigma factor [Polyangia bacterium]|nr:sigma-70 family RNA polymerase sigma factor [Polyangia bacterium]
MRGRVLQFSADAEPDGDRLDIASLYRQHARTVARWAGRLGGHGIDVEDVVQEVFLIAKQRLRRFDGPTQVNAWLFRATEKIVQAARRKQRRRHWLSRSAENPPPGMSAPHPDPGDALQCQRDAACVYRVLDRLNEKQRRVLILFEWEGLSTQEIASLTGVQQTTVRVWLFRARARFLREHAALTGSGDTSREET